MTQPYDFQVSKAGRVISGPDLLIVIDKHERVVLPAPTVLAKLNQAHALGVAEGKTVRDEKNVEALAAAREQRDGWRIIADVLFGAAFGLNLGGMDENPPRELVEAALRPNREAPHNLKAIDQDAVRAIREAFIGRAWHCVRELECDYPLCQHHDDQPRPPDVVHLDIPRSEKGGGSATIKVCKAPTRIKVAGTWRKSRECHQWGLWVQERARAGRITVL